MFLAGSADGDGEQLPVPPESTIVHSTVDWYPTVTVPVGVKPVWRTLAFTLTLKTTLCSLPNEVTGPAIDSLVSEGHGLAQDTALVPAWVAAEATPLIPAARHAEARTAKPSLAGINRIEPIRRMVKTSPVRPYQRLQGRAITI